MPTHLQFSLLPDYLIEMYDNIIHTMSRRGKLLSRKSLSQILPRLLVVLHSENVKDKYSYTQRN